MNRMTEIEIDKYDDKGPHKAGSTLYLVQVKETLTHHYLVSGAGAPKTKKELREDYNEGDGTYSAGWAKKDGWTDFESERIAKIEKVTYSPCTLALRYLTPPTTWLDKDHPKRLMCNPKGARGFSTVGIVSLADTPDAPTMLTATRASCVTPARGGLLEDGASSTHLGRW